MALAQYSELFWFPSGGLAANVVARVFVHNSNTLATLYADAGGTVPLANPLSTSGTGRLEFYAEEGKYWIHIDSEAFEVAVGAAAQAATQQDIDDEVARADAAYAPLVHAARHAAGGGDAVTLTMAQITGLAAALAALAPLAGATFTGPVVVDDANFSVLGVNKGYRFRPLGSRLDCEASGSDWMFSVFAGPAFDGTQRTYLRLESGVTLAHACGTWIFTDTADSGAVHTLDGTGNKLGFHGATSVAQQTVTGSRGGNTALGSLLTALDTLGLIDDQTTA